MQMDFIVWLMNLPQLRRDTLKLYKLNPTEYNETTPEGNDDKLPNAIYSDYLELIKHSLNAQLNSLNEEANILKMITNVYVKCHVSGARYTILTINLILNLTDEINVGWYTLTITSRTFLNYIVALKKSLERKLKCLEFNA